MTLLNGILKLLAVNQIWGPILSQFSWVLHVLSLFSVSVPWLIKFCFWIKFWVILMFIWFAGAGRGCRANEWVILRFVVSSNRGCLCLVYGFIFFSDILWRLDVILIYLAVWSDQFKFHLINCIMLLWHVFSLNSVLCELCIMPNLTPFWFLG